MNGQFSFRELADIVTATPEFQGMEAIVEKELLHYELLHILRRGGWLDKLVFQGGTSLRLLHGSPRMSEDLDFSGGRSFSAEHMAGLATYLERSLPEQAHGLTVNVRPPKGPRRLTGEISVSTWRVDIEIEPRQNHMPKQRIKIDIDNTVSHTKDTRQVRKNYSELPDYNLMVHVQSEEEILANKLVAFPTSIATKSRPRYRDIWDMSWLKSRGHLRIDLLDSKMKEHDVPPLLIDSAAVKVARIVHSPAFAAEMRRFLLPRSIAETLDRPDFMEGLAQETERLFRDAARGLKRTRDEDVPSPSPFATENDPF